MNPDLPFVIGIVLAVLALPALFSALADGRRPRRAAIMAGSACVLVVWAILSRPGGYTVRDIPEAFIRVIAAHVPYIR